MTTNNKCHKHLILVVVDSLTWKAMRTAAALKFRPDFQFNMF